MGYVMEIILGIFWDIKVFLNILWIVQEFEDKNINFFVWFKMCFVIFQLFILIKNNVGEIRCRVSFVVMRILIVFVISGIEINYLMLFRVFCLV